MVTDKDFFKQLKKECKELSGSEYLEEGFPYLCLKIFFPQLSKDEIETSIYGLNTNDESIDAFFVQEDSKLMHIVQFKATETMDLKAAKKEWFSYLYDVPNKLGKQ